MCVGGGGDTKGERGAGQGGGGRSRFYPYKKGVGKVLAMLNGGGGSFNTRTGHLSFRH